MDKVLGVVELSRLLKQKWYWILGLMVFGIVVAHVTTVYFMVPLYSAETRLLVSRPANSAEEIELGEIETNIQMINTYRDIIQDPVVLNEVQTVLNNSISEDELKENLEIVTQSDSQIFSIQVTDSNPNRAALIADTIANVFKESVGSIIHINNVAILSPARIPLEPVSPHYFLNILIGALLGIATSIGGIIIAFVADKRVHDENFSTEQLGWLPLGVISSMSKKEIADTQAAAFLVKGRQQEEASKEGTVISRKEPNHV